MQAVCYLIVMFEQIVHNHFKCEQIASPCETLLL